MSHADNIEAAVRDHAERIMNAAGSSLRNYSVYGTQERILLLSLIAMRKPIGPVRITCYANRSKVMTDKLSDRVERLEGPDREIDRAIKQAFGHDWDYSADWDYWDALKGEKVSKPVAKPYTASLDAAISLVPVPYWMLRNEDGGPVATIMDETGAEFEVKAATPAIALCAAALKARGL